MSIIKHIPTPYIYILFFLSINPSLWSQKIIFYSKANNENQILKIFSNNFNVKDSISQEEAIKTFRNKLSQAGFIDNRITSIEKNDSIWSVDMTLNSKIQKVKLYNDNMLDINQMLQLKKDLTYIELPFLDTSNFLEHLLQTYINNGYPFTKIHLSNIRKEGDLLHIDLDILTEKKRQLDKIIIKGYKKFPQAFIKNQLFLKEGSSFSKKKINLASDNLNGIPFASEIKEPRILFSKDSTFLYLYIKKEKNNSFDGLLGFSNTAEKKGIQLFGNFDLSVRNAMNSGEEFHIKWMGSQDKSQTIDLNTSFPYIFDTAFSLNYNLNIHKQDSLFANLTQDLNISYYIAKRQKIGFEIQNKHSNKTTVSNNNKLETFDSFFYGITYLYNKPNNQRGFPEKFSLYTKVSQGKRNSDKQYKLTNKISYLYSLSYNQNLVIQNTTKILLSKEYLENELYRIGGSMSIRGFDENSIPAKQFSYTNLSYNYLINNDSYLSVMSDTAILNNLKVKSNDFLYSFGIGFSQFIKSGKMSIQYFIGNDKNSPFSVKNTKLHLQFIQGF